MSWAVAIVALLLALSACSASSLDEPQQPTSAPEAQPPSGRPPFTVAVCFEFVLYRGRLLRSARLVPDQVTLPFRSDHPTVYYNPRHPAGFPLYTAVLPDFEFSNPDSLLSIRQMPKLPNPVRRLYFVVRDNLEDDSETPMKQRRRILNILRLLADTYGAAVASRLRFVITLTSPVSIRNRNNTVTELEKIYQQVFSGKDMPPALYWSYDEPPSELTEDLRIAETESETRLNLNPPRDSAITLMPRRNRIRSKQVRERINDNLIWMPIEEVRRYASISDYACFCLQQAAADCVRIPVIDNLDLLSVFTEDAADGLALTEEFYTGLNESDRDMRLGILHELSFLKLRTHVMDTIVDKCRTAIAADLVSMASYSSAAVRQYLQHAFAHTVAQQTASLQYAITAKEYDAWVLDNLLSAAATESLPHLLAAFYDTPASYKSWSVIWRALRNITIDSITTDMPVSFAKCVQYVLQDRIVDINAGLPCLDAGELLTVIQVALRTCALTPDYMQDESAAPLTSLLQIVHDAPSHMITSEFVTSICPDLMRMLEHTPTDLLLKLDDDRRPSGGLFMFLNKTVFPTRHNIGRKSFTDNAKFLEFAEAVVGRVFPGTARRREFFANLIGLRGRSWIADLSATFLLLGLTDDELPAFALELLLPMAQNPVNSLYYPSFVGCMVSFLEGRSSDVLARYMMLSTTEQLLSGPLAPLLASFALNFFDSCSVGFRTDHVSQLVRVLKQAADLCRASLRENTVIFLKYLPKTLLPSVLPALIENPSGLGAELFRQIVQERNLNADQQREIRHMAQTVISPRFWAQFYHDDNVADVVRLGGIEAFFTEWQPQDETQRAAWRRRISFSLWCADLSHHLRPVDISGLLMFVPDDEETIPASALFKLIQRHLSTEPTLLERPLLQWMLQHAPSRLFSEFCMKTYESARERTREHQQISVEFCRRLVLALMQHDPLRAAHAFAVEPADVARISPALSYLLEQISNELSTRPQIPTALGARILTLHYAFSNNTEQKHRKRWLEFMLPISARYPTGSVTPGDLAMVVVCDLPAAVVQENPGPVLDLIRTLPEAEFGRLSGTKSILSQMLLIFTQVQNINGFDTALAHVVQRTQSWTNVISVEVFQQVRTGMSTPTKLVLEDVVVSAWNSGHLRQLPDSERNVVAALLFGVMADRDRPLSAYLRSLHVQAQLLHLPNSPPIYAHELDPIAAAFHVFQLVLELYEHVAAQSAPRSPYWSAEAVFAQFAFVVRNMPLECFQQKFDWRNVLSMLLYMRGLQLQDPEHRALVELALRHSDPEVVRSCLQRLYLKSLDNTDPELGSWFQDVLARCRDVVGPDSYNYEISKVSKPIRGTTHIGVGVFWSVIGALFAALVLYCGFQYRKRRHEEEVVSDGEADSGDADSTQVDLDTVTNSGDPDSQLPVSDMS